MRKGKAFTLIELLVVIAIIALLVSILVPSLTRARDMAKKAVCSTNISNHGKSMAMYVALYDSYPVMSPWPARFSFYTIGTDTTNPAYGWPTFYALLEMNEMIGTHRTTWGNWYFGAPVDQIWDGCVCPAMDAPSIWAAQDNMPNLPDFAGDGSQALYNMSFHKWAVGYQFSEFLRSATPDGRYPSKPGPKALWENVEDLYQWFMGNANLLDGNTYYLQAIRDEELAQASQTFMATDGWDLESTPSAPWLTQAEFDIHSTVTPGMHVGPPLSGAKAWFNSYRHKGCPNILYADGHVATDANKPIDTDGWPAVYAGMQACTYPHNIARYFGNLDRIIPVPEMEE
jgi:prepilin-type N-terminal cleavage/methylation domain-containing protein/prepilin-type processing-associated H-X9-DG protein